MKYKHLFWTGGWDSTFRVCQLIIDKKQLVQPIFVTSMRKAGGERLNIVHELQAIDLIRYQLENSFPEASTRLKRLKIISSAKTNSKLDMPKGPGLTEGWQYSVLGSIAAKWKEPIELCIEKSESDHNEVGNSIIPYAKKIDDVYRLEDDLPQDKLDKLSTKGLVNFIHFHFPLLHTSRSKMKELSKLSGYYNILKMTWSCLRFCPDNSQCGKCFSCKGRKRDGVWFEKPFLNHEPLNSN